MAKLTDKRKKQIIAAYIDCKNYSKVAKQYGVSRTTVKRLVENDPKTVKLIADKDEQNTKDVLAYMDERRDKACDFINQCLEEMSKPERMMEASMKEIAMAFGIVIDKFTRAGGASEDKNGKLQKLIEGIKNE